MHKLSVVGIDNSGKTSVVKSLNGITGISTIYLTNYQNNSSRIARISGGVVNKFAQFSSSHNLKSAAGLAYFLHLFPYYIEERTKSSSKVLVSDRDPIIDTLCYSEVYTPNGFSRTMKSSLRFMLEHSFNYPNSFCYLEALPETSARRNNKPSQLHDEIEHLSRLKELFEEEMFLAEKKGKKVFRINTEVKTIREVIDEVRFYAERLL